MANQLNIAATEKQSASFGQFLFLLFFCPSESWGSQVRVWNSRIVVWLQRRPNKDLPGRNGAGPSGAGRVGGSVGGRWGWRGKGG